MGNRMLAVLIAALFLAFGLGEHAYGAGSVGVIAPSISTSAMARNVRMKLGLSEIPLHRAGTILVVVRSALYDPLSYSYRSVRDLEADADMQLNIAGPKFHIYFYDMHRLGVSQTTHKSLDAAY